MIDRTYKRQENITKSSQTGYWNGHSSQKINDDYLVFLIFWFYFKTDVPNQTLLHLLTDRWITALIKYHWMSIWLGEHNINRARALF